MMKRIVITGASGMIGSNLAKYALEHGCEVLCIIRPGSTKEKNLPVNRNLKIIYSTIDRYNEISAEGSWDVFFHFAWEKTFGASRDDVDSQLDNIQYTLDAVRLAKRFGCYAFIGAGSQAEYGPVDSILKPDTPTNPLSGYGIAKYTAGKLSCLLCEQLGIRHNWIRILSVYGSHDNINTLIMYAFITLKNGKSPDLTKCEQIWDYLNEKDAGAAFFSIGESGINKKTYVLGSGKGLVLSKYLEELRDVVNPEICLNLGKIAYYPNQPMYLVADVSDLTTDTGWQPKISFSEGVRSLVQEITG